MCGSINNCHLSCYSCRYTIRVETCSYKLPQHRYKSKINEKRIILEKLEKQDSPGILLDPIKKHQLTSRIEQLRNDIMKIEKQILAIKNDPKSVLPSSSSEATESSHAGAGESDDDAETTTSSAHQSSSMSISSSSSTQQRVITNTHIRNINTGSMIGQMRSVVHVGKQPQRRSQASKLNVVVQDVPQTSPTQQTPSSAQHVQNYQQQISPVTTPSSVSSTTQLKRKKRPDLNDMSQQQAQQITTQAQQQGFMMPQTFTSGYPMVSGMTPQFTSNVATQGLMTSLMGTAGQYNYGTNVMFDPTSSTQIPSIISQPTSQQFHLGQLLAQPSAVTGASTVDTSATRKKRKMSAPVTPMIQQPSLQLQQPQPSIQQQQQQFSSGHLVSTQYFQPAQQSPTTAQYYHVRSPTVADPNFTLQQLISPSSMNVASQNLFASSGSSGGGNVGSQTSDYSSALLMSMMQRKSTTDYSTQFSQQLSQPTPFNIFNTYMESSSTQQQQAHQQASQFDSSSTTVSFPSHFSQSFPQQQQQQQSSTNQTTSTPLGNTQVQQFFSFQNTQQQQQKPYHQP